MRAASFHHDELRIFLRRNRIATLSELKQALGTSVGVTVFRKLKQLDYLASYSHRGSYYTLREVAHFDNAGLWSDQSVWFSRYGTLVNTVEAFVAGSPKGYFADELARVLHVEVQDTLLLLFQQHRIWRRQVSGRYLYTSTEILTRQQQLLARREQLALPILANPSVLEVSVEELKASIILFYSLLDEKQRRLYAGLESLKLGHGGDRRLAEILGLDAHTIGRGRQELLDQDVEVDRVRRVGGGRKLLEKKRRKS